MKKLLAGVAIGAAVVLGTAGGAFAGEITGTGADTSGPSHSRSACAFSGLEDNNFEAPVQPGTVQNFGHTKQAFGITGGANSVVTPFGEEGCNAHAYPNK